MLSIVSFVLIGIVFGIMAVIGAFFWSWGLFGDIFHQNSISSMWFIPIIVIFLISLFVVRISPQLMKELDIGLWHYIAVIGGFLLGGSIFILYIRQ